MSAKITQALHAVMSKVGYVQKTGENKFHNYRYAGEADLLDKLRPAMIEAGLLLLPSGKSVTGPDAHGNVTVEVAYTLAHRDGDVWPTPLVAFGCGNDMAAKSNRIGDKGVYKALTGANKYLLFKLFQIETGDDPEKDDDAPERAPAKPRAHAETNPPPRQNGSSDARSTGVAMNAKEDDALATALIAAIGKTKSIPELAKWADAFKAQVETLSDEGQGRVREQYKTKRKALLDELGQEVAA